jgi:L-ascorbate metabolism protein UlaG (beta-lactamase superfamily)
LITHEHQDHLHIDSLKIVLKNNPDAKIFTNNGVAKLLDKEHIKYEIIDDKKTVKAKNVLIEGIGKKHAEIYKTLPSVENTGYFIAGRLFYPGDAFYNPKRPVEILALPVAGPWMKISEAIDYALEIKPKFAFPVHDGMLIQQGKGPFKWLGETILGPAGIKIIQMEENKEILL